MNYSTDIRKTAVEKLMRPGASFAGISEEMGIPKVTLYAWRRYARNGAMKGKRGSISLREKQALVLEARGLPEEARGRWLREKGFHEAELNSWIKEIDSFLETIEGRSGREAEQRARIKELERDLHRKDKALAELSALVVLKKKLARILGEEEESPK